MQRLEHVHLAEHLGQEAGEVVVAGVQGDQIHVLQEGEPRGGLGAPQGGAQGERADRGAE